MPDAFESLCQTDLFYKLTGGPSITPEPPAKLQGAPPNACKMLTSPFLGSCLRDWGMFLNREACTPAERTRADRKGEPAGLAKTPHLS